MNVLTDADCLLTIAIPTYNRPCQLKHTLMLLAPQIRPSVSIAILDNASNPPINFDTLCIGHGLAPFVRIIRNNFNIGGNANIVKCLEICQSPYIWILGDDDIPASNSVDIILGAISHSPDAVAFSFNYHSSRQVYTTCLGVSELALACFEWSDLVFISNNVYNHAIFSGYVDYGYEYVYAWAPLVAILLKALQEHRRTVLLSPCRLIDNNQPADNAISWSPIEFQLRKYEILNIQMNACDRRALGYKISKSNNAINSSFVCHVCAVNSRQDILVMDRLLFSHFQYAEFTEKLKVLLFAIFIRFPRLARFFLYSIIGPKRINVVTKTNLAKKWYN
jgi:hypothetical protein